MKLPLALALLLAPAFHAAALEPLKYNREYRRLGDFFSPKTHA